MEEWKEVRLGDIAQVKGGKRLPKGINLLKKRNMHPYIRVRDLGNKKTLCLDNNFEYVDNETQKLISRYIVNTDDIIISIVGTIGLISIIDKSLDKANLSENCVKIINISNIDNDYLYYYLVSDRGQNEIRKGTVGAVQAKLPIKNIKAINITLSSLPEQKAIAATLSCLDDKIELNNHINKTLEEIAQAIFKSWFVDFGPFKDGEFEDSELGRIPKGWKVGTLGDVLTLNYGESLPARKRIDGNIRVYSSAGITGFHNKALVNEPSIIVGRKGSIGTVYFSIEPSFCIDTAYYVTQKDSKFPLLLMYQLLKELKLSQYNEDSAVPGLNRNTAYLMSIIIPPESVLKKCNELLVSIYSLFFDNQKQNQKLTAIRDTLLPKLMSGEIRVPIEEVTTNKQG